MNLNLFLKFNLTNNFRLSENMEKVDFDAMICHEIEYKKITKYINNFNKCLKILVLLK